MRPDGGLAAPAELRLPAAALEAELGAGLAPAVNAADPRDDSFYAYNSSAMTPLVPLWLSWMTDAERMANRSHGLDFAVRQRDYAPNSLLQQRRRTATVPEQAVSEPQPGVGRGSLGGCASCVHRCQCTLI